MTPIALPPLALTMGEPAGIGGEITLKAWAGRHRLDRPFLVLDDPDRLRALAAQLGLSVPVAEISDATQAEACFGTALPVLRQELPRIVGPGQPHAGNVPAVAASIARAVTLAREGAVAGVVTNPIAKAVMAEGGFTFPGHTEYLAHLAGAPGAKEVMMLACPGLRVVPVTIHVSLIEAIRLLTTDLICETGRVVAQALKSDFGIVSPRLAVAGLNPHAGEEGTMGREDRDIVAPAVARLRAMGIDAHGPLPADTLFHEEARRSYDAALGMYHDQALIPIKTLDFHGGVNVTLGLPFVRTSPDHGTAFSLAGTGTARPESLIAALNMASAIAVNRDRSAPAS